ncbi:MAG: adenine deaminase [Paludibacteraceae bacterium]|nr:adenine deaminase [Paludibacteraceae bacterium]
MESTFKLEGYIADIYKEEMYKAVINVTDGVITSITKDDTLPDDMNYIMPGLIDAHVHIESSMLLPSEFARMAVKHGVTGIVTDPHEIANVLGEPGIDFMIEDSKKVRFNFLFGAPSCVPSTKFETSGATLDSTAVERLMQRDDIAFLSEMMNYPGVLSEDKDVMAKIAAAKKHNKPIDGHAPALSGEGLVKYAGAGITTEHECATTQEAEEKIKRGMKILIREGSAAKNFDALYTLIDKYPDSVMMCTDDMHPDELCTPHSYIDGMCIKALKYGCDLRNVLKAGSVNAAKHYGIKHASIKVGERAEFVVLDENWNVKQTYIDGAMVYDEELGIIKEAFWRTPRNIEGTTFPNVMNHEKISADEICTKAEGERTRLNIISVENGQIYTKTDQEVLEIQDGKVMPSVEKDVLKMVVVNRYDSNVKPAVAYIRGFGLKRGAFGSTISHDCHNIVCVGTDDDSIVKVVNRLVELKGGMVAVDGDNIEELELPLAGLMSPLKGRDVANTYRQLNSKVKELGTSFHAPFMTLSFMTLLVIPELKLSDKGLFDGKQFKFTDIFTQRKISLR